MIDFTRQLPREERWRTGRRALGLGSATLLVCGQAGSLSAEEQAVLLPEIVVSASRVPLPSREVGSAVTIIDGEELEQRQIRVVSDVLRDVPGLAVNRTGPVGAPTQVRIRGAEGNQTLVLIDGIEVNNPAASSEFNFANLMNVEIERIEVLRGPQSALYGSDALGGVVSIITKGADRGFSISGRAEAGSFATRDALASIGYGSETFYVTGTLNRFATDGVSVADEADGNSEVDDYDNTTARIKVGIKPFEFLEIDAAGMLIDSERDGDSSALVVGAVDSDEESASRQRYGQARAKLILFDGRWEQIVRASFIDDDTDYFDDTGSRTFRSEGEKTKFDYQTNVFFGTPELAGAEHTLTFAAEREREEQFTDSAFSGSNRVEVVNNGTVGEYRVDLWERLFLSASLRYDDNDSLFEDEITYRGTAAYLHEETGTRLHGSAGRGVKNPTLFELFGSTPNFSGNPNLKAERSVGWDAGVEQSLFDDRLVLDVTYFNNRIEDLIQSSGISAVNLDGSSEIHGFEVTASAEPVDGLRLTAAYTYNSGEDANGTELIRRAKHIASFNANYALEAFDRPGNVNLAVRYNGDQDDWVFDSYFPLQRRTVELGSYTLVSISANLEVFDGVELFARGENLLDEDYQEVYGFGTPGISAFAGLRLNFGPYGIGAE